MNMKKNKRETKMRIENEPIKKTMSLLENIEQCSPFLLSDRGFYSSAYEIVSEVYHRAWK